MFEAPGTGQPLCQGYNKKEERGKKGKKKDSFQSISKSKIVFPQLNHQVGSDPGPTMPHPGQNQIDNLPYIRKQFRQHNTKKHTAHTHSKQPIET